MKRLNNGFSAGGLTTPMLLLSALYIATHWMTGQTDLTVWAMSQNRRLPELKQVVGMLSTQLPLRVGLSPDDSVLDLCQQVREAYLSAEEWNFVPTSVLRKQMKVAGGSIVAPYFNYERISKSAGACSDAGAIAPMHIPYAGRRTMFGRDSYLCYPFGLRAVEDGDGVVGTITYAPDRYAPATIRQFADHLISALEQMADNPGARLGQLKT
jgi:non-ribosomal peptide synthetase component F